MWLLGFEPRSPRPQRGILTTKLQPQRCTISYSHRFICSKSTTNPSMEIELKNAKCGCWDSSPGKKTSTASPKLNPALSPKPKALYKLQTPFISA
ncbi:hypothetical protein L1887_23604 [Cichorium endivia]|nr:hypothetical protein L1887_23604 [Cichorium endivia]